MKKLLQLFLFTLTLTTVAQDYTVDLDYYLPEDVTYNPAVPTPKSAIGHEVGDWHITHDKLSYYMKALADASDRITLEDRGTTFEGRPLQLLIITSPANHNNIDNIRQNHVAQTAGKYFIKRPAANQIFTLAPMMPPGMLFAFKHYKFRLL